MRGPSAVARHALVLSCDSLLEVVGDFRFDLIVSNELDSTLGARSVSTW